MNIGYARVSTRDQNLDMQIDKLKEAGCEKVFSEEVSGAADERPELERCIDALRDGDTLHVYKLDRFGRSMSDLVEKITALEERGVDFVSLTEGIDTTTAQGKLVFHIFGALAEFERELIRERTMAGLEAAREEGRTGGRPPALSEDEIPQVQALMKDPDISTKDICERFDVGKTTLYRYVAPNGERRK